MPFNPMNLFEIKSPFFYSMNPFQIYNNYEKNIQRIKREYDLCCKDDDLVQIGCNFGL